MADRVPAVLFIVFKRLDTTARVFEAIRAARPAQLYVAADGPRLDRAGEAELCRQVRAVVSAVDWPCQLRTRFREVNVGTKRNIAEAITWFLDEVGEGVILEDDCLPSPDFFTFAADLLQYYRHDEAIQHISGSNFQPRPIGQGSYFFSRYNHGWGWATWKRAWDRCDLELRDLDTFLERFGATHFWDSARERRYWERIFQHQKAGLMDTWDYQWKFTLWRDQGLAIYPNFNMISNLGFNAQATNTVGHDALKADRPWQDPIRDGQGGLIHPTARQIDQVADRWTFENLYWGRPADRLRAKLRKLKALVTRRS